MSKYIIRAPMDKDIPICRKILNRNFGRAPPENIKKMLKPGKH
ncbi:MAG: hypothetical protein ACFFDH_04810 [Promethearchaeota archaeon]